MNTLTLSILQFCLVMLGTFILLYSRQKLITEIASLKCKISIINRDNVTFRRRIKRKIIEDRDRRSEEYSSYKARCAAEVYILRLENADLRKSKLETSTDEEALAYGRAWNEHEVKIEKDDIRKSKEACRSTLHGNLKNYGNGIYEIEVTCRWCGHKDIFISISNESSCHCSSCDKNSLGNIKE